MRRVGWLVLAAVIEKAGGELMSSTDIDAFLHEILSTVKAIAVVGASDKESRPSYGVLGFLVKQGYHVVGVNPNLAGRRIHGAPFYKTLAEVPGLIDMVNIFRNSEAARGVNSTICQPERAATASSSRLWFSVVWPLVVDTRR
jgi:predicted CoA-binding protein